ncbi:MAG: DUF3616 domain-containing protein [Anaerolinea sp.]|nr:DUF3616 domain-containing protein [Anaerolinea sp.]
MLHKYLQRGRLLRFVLAAALLLAALSSITPSQRIQAGPGPIWISEILSNPAGTDEPHEYVELRGTPNSTIGADTYLLGIEGDTGAACGDVQTIFSLSGKTFGPNGFMIFRMGSNSYSVNPGAASFVGSTANSFGGIPGFSADSPGVGIENPSFTFMLITVNSGGTIPTLTTDIDSDNNGQPDTAYATWTVQDSIGISDGGATDCFYGDINFFTGAATANTISGATNVTGLGFSPIGYVGRPTGDPTGSTAADWVVSNTTTGTAPNFTLTNPNTSPTAYRDDALDHLGGPNFPAAANTAPAVTVFPAGRSGVYNAALSTQQDFSGTNGYTFNVQDADGIASVSITGNSDTNVLPNANVTLTDLGGTTTNHNYRIEISGPGTTSGISNLTITATDSNATPSATSVTFTYATNLDDSATPDDRYLTGSAEASTVIAIDANNMFVGDDKDQTVRLYDRNVSRLPYSGFDFTTNLLLTDLNAGVPREVDIEASTRSGTTLYWLGSHSNDTSGGTSRPNRSRVFATTLSGSGTGATLAYVGHYNFLKDDLIAWDNANGHGLGAGALGFQASAAAGVNPETINGFNIEGLSLTPFISGTSAYLAFRAPLLPTSARTQALIVPVTNFTSLFGSTTGGTAGSATFGAPIFLNLGGRGIRSLECNAVGCLIVAGPYGSSGDFQLYSWSGIASEAPVAIVANLTGFAVRPEGFAEMPTGAINTWNSQQIQIVSDDGDDVFFGSTPSGAQTIVELRKFRTDRITLGMGVPPGTVRIRNIQGTTFRSPLVGTGVSNVPGVVTALRSNGFYIQDPDPTGDDGLASSEAVFVFTTNAAILSPRYVGEAVLVTGTVTEFYPGGVGAGNLSITEISNNAGVRPLSVTAWDCLSSPTCTITPTVIGVGGRMPPTSVISSFVGDVDTKSALDVTEGLDFMESLEMMLVQINNPVVVGPTNNFGEIWLLADNGANATGRNSRGGITISAGDFNPERIQIDDGLTGGPAMPTVDVGATLSTIIGVVDYNFGNFEVLVRDAFSATPSTITPETTVLTGSAIFSTFATFNVENLDPGDGQAEFDARGQVIAENLLSPDIVMLQEIQDNNGATNDSVVDASVTLNTLIASIVAAGGATDYQFVVIDPVDDQDGGEPGGNIRVAILYRTNRVTFTPLAGGTSTAANAVVCSAGVPSLQFNPGRIDPTNAAWSSSRKPLAAQFTVQGESFFIINNHFNSKGGDQALYGRNQPPTLSSETQRMQQATLVRDFVNQILLCNANANVIIAGDLNDFQFSNPVTLLTGTTPALSVMNTAYPTQERYGYIFDGNGQALDQILVSPNLINAWGAAYDSVHLNSEFYTTNTIRVSDHDPSVLRIGIEPVVIEPTAVPGVGAVAGGTNEPLTLPATGYEAEAGSSVSTLLVLLAGIGLIAVGAMAFGRRGRR